MRCKGCGYRLHDLPDNRCPECGHIVSRKLASWVFRFVVTVTILGSITGLLIFGDPLPSFVRYSLGGWAVLWLFVAWWYVRRNDVGGMLVDKFSGASAKRPPAEGHEETKSNSK